jgi:catechol 2,3-dioxygenase-like lactoylglutathione lyase family enzyme
LVEPEATVSGAISHDAPVAPSVHHVGYLTADVEAAAAELGTRLGLETTRRFERPEYSLFGVYLGAGPGNIEVFSFSDETLVAPRLGPAPVLLEHVAYAVPDIRATAANMRARGVRFSGPDGREEAVEPIDLGGVLHLWTTPSDGSGLTMQLVQG